MHYRLMISSVGLTVSQWWAGSVLTVHFYSPQTLRAGIITLIVHLFFTLRFFGVVVTLLSSSRWYADYLSWLHGSNGVIRVSLFTEWLDLNHVKKQCCDDSTRVTLFTEWHDSSQINFYKISKRLADKTVSLHTKMSCFCFSDAWLILALGRMAGTFK